MITAPISFAKEKEEPQIRQIRLPKICRDFNIFNHDEYKSHLMSE